MIFGGGPPLWQAPPILDQPALDRFYTIHYDTAPDLVERHVHARIGANAVALGPTQSNASVVGEPAYRRATDYLRDLAERTGETTRRKTTAAWRRLSLPLQASCAGSTS